MWWQPHHRVPCSTEQVVADRGVKGTLETEAGGAAAQVVPLNQGVLAGSAGPCEGNHIDPELAVACAVPAKRSIRGPAQIEADAGFAAIRVLHHVPYATFTGRLDPKRD